VRWLDSLRQVGCRDLLPARSSWLRSKVTLVDRTSSGEQSRSSWMGRCFLLLLKHRQGGKVSLSVGVGVGVGVAFFYETWKEVCLQGQERLQQARAGHERTTL
jgi:hypothetical protein